MSGLEGDVHVVGLVAHVLEEVLGHVRYSLAGPGDAGGVALGYLVGDYRDESVAVDDGASVGDLLGCGAVGDQIAGEGCD